MSSWLGWNVGMSKRIANNISVPGGAGGGSSMPDEDFCLLLQMERIPQLSKFYEDYEKAKRIAVACARDAEEYERYITVAADYVGV